MGVRGASDVPPAGFTEPGRLSDPPGHIWRDKWTALSGPLSGIKQEWEASRRSHPPVIAGCPPPDGESQSLRRGRQKSTPPQGSGFQKSTRVLSYAF